MSINTLGRILHSLPLSYCTPVYKNEGTVPTKPRFVYYNLAICIDLSSTISTEIMTLPYFVLAFLLLGIFHTHYMEF